MNTADRKPVSWQELLHSLGTLLEQEPMARHTTLGVGGPARWFFRPSSAESLVRAIRLLPPDLPRLPLGRGSNLLIADSGFDGVVIDLAELNEIHVKDRQIQAQAGARMSRVARICADHGLSGLEFMSTVPGDIGGGVAMNAGAFGQQVADTLRQVRLLLPDGETIDMRAAELRMSYRHCELPSGALIVAAEFSLHEEKPVAIRRRISEMRQRRGLTQPLSQPNCGSVFKNPPGDHAARLIESAGLKGLVVGGASISEKHANFIVNHGSASSKDILELIRTAKKEVFDRFGIQLEPEVRIIGGAL